MAPKAFVSSTYQDLAKHRAYVIRELRQAGFAVDPMEDWTAAPSEPKEFSSERVVGCDLCVLLVGLRRGHVPKGERLSITQLEYETARELEIDTLVFMLEEDAPWSRAFDELDSDPGIRAWREELQETAGVGFFGTDPTSIQIAPALTRWIQARGPAEGSSSEGALARHDPKRLEWGIGVLERRIRGLRRERQLRAALAGALIVIALVVLSASLFADGDALFGFATGPLTNGSIMLGALFLVPANDYLSVHRHIQRAAELKDAMEADLQVGAVATEWYLRQVKAVLSIKSGVTL